MSLNEQSQPSGFAQSWFEFLQVLQKRFWTIRLFVGITLGVVAVGTWLQTPLYRASASVLIDMETPSLLSVSTLRDDSTVAQTHYLTYADYYRTQLEIMSSRSLAERVFVNLQLAGKPEYARAEDPVGALLKRVEVEAIKQTRLAKIHVEDKDPATAARLANEFAAVFVLENLKKTSLAESMTLKKNEYLKLQAKEAELSKRYKDKHPALIRIRNEMEQMTRTLPQELEDFRPLEERLQENALSGSLRPNNIRVQDLARPPLRPFRPRKLLNLLLGLFLGTVGGVGMALLQELADVSLQGPEDVEQAVKVALLGHVPRMTRVEGERGREFEAACRFAQVEGFSPAAEAYRTIRTTLLYATPMNGTRTVVFTSPGPGEGKTTTISNLAVAIARDGAKILLVDADLRKGRLHEVFKLPRGPGLSEYLTGQVSFQEVLRPTDVPGLSLVTCGNYPPYPAELVGSQAMRNFLEMARPEFSRVFVDTPPVIAVTDAIILSAISKTVIAVAESGRTPRKALEKLVKSCSDVNAKVLGVILNNVPAWSAPYYSKYSSYGYSGYAPRQGGENGYTPVSRPA